MRDHAGVLESMRGMLSWGSPRPAAQARGGCDAYASGVTYGLFATFVAADGARDELVRHLLDAATLLDDDPACLRYIVGTTGEDGVAVFEVWDDESAHDSSLEREDIRGIINVARPLIAEMGSAARLEVRGGKGV